MPVELDALEQWGVGQRLLEGVLAGAELKACMQAEIARGALPPGELARPALAEIGAVVDQIAGAAKALGADRQPGSLDLNLALPDGRTLAGTVTGVCGDTVRAISYSRVKPRDRLRAWVRLLALSAARPERAFESVVIGRARADARWAGVTVARIPPLADDPGRPARRPRSRISRRCSTCTTAACASRCRSRPTRLPHTRTRWSPARTAKAPRPPREPPGRPCSATTRRTATPSICSSTATRSRSPGCSTTARRDDEQGPGWDEAETTRFGRYALRLWRGLLAVEAVSDR